MKRLLAWIAVLSLFSLSCKLLNRISQAGETIVGPGEKISLSETLKVDGIPNAVIPNGIGSSLQFSNLRLNGDGDHVDGKVDFTRQGQEDFVLVVVLSMQDEMLIGYLDPGYDFILHLPSGTVLFGTQGYQVPSGERGTAEFSMMARVFNGFDVTGGSGSAYVFSVPGKVSAQSTLPGDQTDRETYQANSNVLKVSFNLK